MNHLLLQLPETEEIYSKGQSLIEKCLEKSVKVNNRQGSLIPSKETIKSTQTREFLETNSSKKLKARNALKVSEIQHFSNILKHPAFIQNPFDTIQLHLQNVAALSKK